MLRKELQRRCQKSVLQRRSVIGLKCIGSEISSVERSGGGGGACVDEGVSWLRQCVLIVCDSGLPKEEKFILGSIDSGLAGTHALYQEISPHGCIRSHKVYILPVVLAGLLVMRR